MQTRTGIIIVVGAIFLFLFLALPPLLNLRQKLNEKTLERGLVPHTTEGLDQLEPQAKRASKY